MCGNFRQGTRTQKLAENPGMDFEYYLASAFLKAASYVALPTVILYNLFVLFRIKMTSPTHRGYHSSIELFYI